MIYINKKEEKKKKRGLSSKNFVTTEAHGLYTLFVYGLALGSPELDYT